MRLEVLERVIHGKPRREGEFWIKLGESEQVSQADASRRISCCLDEGLPDVFKKQTRAPCSWTKENKEIYRRCQEVMRRQRMWSLRGHRRSLGFCWEWRRNHWRVWLEYLLNSWNAVSVTFYREQGRNRADSNCFPSVSYAKKYIDFHCSCCLKVSSEEIYIIYFMYYL